jgi:hypothetical protein
MDFYITTFTVLFQLVQLPKMGQQFKSFGYLDGYSFLKMMDYLWMLLIFLALIACFTAFGMLRTRK